MEGHPTVFTNAFGETTFSSSPASHDGSAHERAPVVRRAIFDDSDVDKFKASETCASLLTFIQECSHAVIGKNITGTFDETRNVHIIRIEAFMNELMNLIEETPPLKQPMRFGNKAFRSWHQKLTIASAKFVNDFLSSIESPKFTISDALVQEIAAYLNASFGNEVRIDYGTGHELNMLVFLFCLHKLEILTKDDLHQAILIGFVSYVRVMRKLQITYMLEPAGSHGVWGLDDYHCLTFLFGAAQLCSHDHELMPSSVHDQKLLDEYEKDYLYFEGIAFIKRIKSSAPFSETSPMLNDISGLADWSRVTNGLVRLFQGEVLFKRPVVQHLPFGSIFKCTWEPSHPMSAAVEAPTRLHNGGIMPINYQSGIPMRPKSINNGGMAEFMNTQAPWAKK